MTMSNNKATITFTDLIDGELEISMKFENDQVDLESNSHLAAMMAHNYIVDKLDKMMKDNDESAE